MNSPITAPTAHRFTSADAIVDALTDGYYLRGGAEVILRDGDVLTIESEESAVGFLFGTWGAALTQPHGPEGVFVPLNIRADQYLNGHYAASVKLGREIAAQLGLHIAPTQSECEVPIGTRIRTLRPTYGVEAGGFGTILGHSLSPLAYVVVFDDDPKRQRLLWDAEEVVTADTEVKPCPAKDDDGDCDDVIPVDRELCAYHASKK